MFQVIISGRNYVVFEACRRTLSAFFFGRSALNFSFQVVPGSNHFDWGIKALNPKAFSATRIEEPDHSECVSVPYTACSNRNMLTRLGLEHGVSAEWWINAHGLQEALVVELVGITDFDVLLWNMDLLQAEAESVFVWY